MMAADGGSVVARKRRRMKKVYLLRHAKSSWKDQSLADLDRPLNKRGRAAAKYMRGVIARERYLPAQILCSPARRTRETLHLLIDAFGGAVPVRYEKGIYLAEAQALLRRMRRLSESLGSVMIIGHNPGLELLALMLTDDDGSPLRHALSRKFPTGTLAVIDCSVDHWNELRPAIGRLAAFERPRIDPD